MSADRTTSRWLQPLLALLLASVVHGAWAAKPNLNPEHGDPAYRELSVFSPDAADPTEYREDVVVVLHGFMSAVPNGTFKRIRKKLRSTHTALGINYAPLDVAGTRRFLAQVADEHLAGRRVTVVGTSLGGFWARYLGHLAKAHRVVLLNPVVQPAEQLAKYIGVTRTNPRRKLDYTTTAPLLAGYADMDVRDMVGASTLLILTDDDGQLDQSLTHGAYGDDPDVTVQVYAKGGHTINLKKHEALGRIADFVATGR